MTIKSLIITSLTIASFTSTVKADSTGFCLVVKTGNKEMDKKIHDAFKYGNGVPACLKFVQTGNIDTVGLFEVYFRESQDAVPQSFYTDAGYDINWYTDWTSPIKFTGTPSKEIPYIKVLKSINAVWGIRILAEGMSQPIMFERPLNKGAAIREYANDMAFNSIIINLSYLMRQITLAHPNLCDNVNKKQ